MVPYIPRAAPYPIKVDQGATLSFGLVRKDYRKRLRPMVDYTARMQVRTDYESDDIILELTTENGGLIIDGERALLQVYATDAQTQAIPEGKYVYDIEVIAPPSEESVVERLVGGTFTVRPEVTR